MIQPKLEQTMSNETDSKSVRDAVKQLSFAYRRSAKAQESARRIDGLTETTEAVDAKEAAADSMATSSESIAKL